MEILALIGSSYNSPTFLRAYNFQRVFKELECGIEFKIVCREEKYTFSDLLKYFSGLFRGNIDIVQVFDPVFPASPSGVAISKIRQKLMVVDTGDLHGKLARVYGHPFWKMKATDFFERICMKYANVIVVRGRFHKEILAMEGYNTNKIFHIPDGVNIDAFSPKKSEFKSKSNLESDFVIGYVGSICSIKIEDLKLPQGWELIAALQELKAKGRRNIKALIIGGFGLDLLLLKNFAKAEGVENDVILTGWVNHSQVPDLINAMDVCISGAYASPEFSVRTTSKLPEYMACGKCIIAAGIGDTSYLLADGTGILVNACKLKKSSLKTYITNLANAVEMIMENPDLAKRMGENAREKAIALFDWRKLARVLKNVYSFALES